MKRSTRRQLFNLFAFALLAFAIYLTVFHKDEGGMNRIQSAPTAKPVATVKVHAGQHH